MYKKLLPSLMIVCSTYAASAQSTLTAANFNPQIGDAFVVHNCDTTGVTEGPSGAQTWNFSSMVTTSVDTGHAVSCLSTSHCSMFPGSTLALSAPPSHLIQFISADASKLSQVGYYQAADTNLVLSNFMDQLHYPFTYLDTFTDAYAGTLTFSLATAVENGTVGVFCDGYGTLMLPGGVTFDSVLRVHSAQNFTDSTNLFGTPTIENFNISTYTWYRPNFHSALLTISTVTQTGAASASYELVSYVPSKAPTAVPTVNNLTASLTLYPNPAQNELNIAFSTTSNKPMRITLTDVTGREIAVIAAGSAQNLAPTTYNTTGLAKGLYLVRLQCGVETVTRKLVIE